MLAAASKRGFDAVMLRLTCRLNVSDSRLGSTVPPLDRNISAEEKMFLFVPGGLSD